MTARLGRLNNQRHPLPTLAKEIFQSYADFSAGARNRGEDHTAIRRDDARS
jgi:hypothetical protein